MKRESIPRVDVSRRDVEAFRDACLYARAMYRHFETLFETSAEERKVLREVAPVFFGDINRAMRECILLQVSKLTDPDVDQRRNLNLSSEFFARNCDLRAWPTKQDRLNELSCQLHEFGGKAKSARNKLIAHLDRSTTLARESHGGIERRAWDEFWVALQEFVRILHEHYCGHSIEINGVAISDAHALLVLMKGEHK